MQLDADPGDGLVIVSEDDAFEVDDADLDPEDAEETDVEAVDPDLESLRDEFVEVFNARDLDGLLELVADDVEVPDIAGDGVASLSEELIAIWARTPSLLLTRAFQGGRPCAVAWVLDDTAGWDRVALVCLDLDGDGLISLVEVADDPEALARAATEPPDGDDPDEGVSWTEWEAGEERVLASGRDGRR